MRPMNEGVSEPPERASSPPPAQSRGHGLAALQDTSASKAAEQGMQATGLCKTQKLAEWEQGCWAMGLRMKMRELLCLENTSHRACCIHSTWESVGTQSKGLLWRSPVNQVPPASPPLVAPSLALKGLRQETCSKSEGEVLHFKGELL